MNKSPPGIETFNKTLDQAQAGDDVGVLLRGINRNDIKGGTMVCAPGSIKSIKRFQVHVVRSGVISSHLKISNIPIYLLKPNI